MLRIVFMGTPDFAAPYLDALLADGHTIPLVVTQPDRPKGRGQQLAPPPVKVKALALGLTVAQPASLRGEDFHALIAAQKADLLVVVAFRILPATLFPLARFGAVNVHGSLLPKYRGAAPIQWAIARGEKETGVTVFQLDAEIDHGEILGTAKTPIGPNETSGELFLRLSAMGLDLLRGLLPDLAAGKCRPIGQMHGEASPAPKLRKEDGLLDWTQPADVLHNRIRAFNPYPIAFTSIPSLGKTLRIYRSEILPSSADSALQPGEIALDGERFPVVGTGNGELKLLEVQLEGRPRVSGPEWINGLRGAAGLRLAIPPQRA